MAGKYYNEICPVCQHTFSDDDDIVVCPDCGTPYHRECYMQNGQCANKDKHGDFEWKSRTSELVEQLRAREQAILEQQEKENPDNPQTDPEQPQDYKTWAAAQQERAKEAFEDLKSKGADIDGVPIDEVAAFVGKNVFYYIPLFQKFSKTNTKISFNLSAGLFCPLQQLYRRMNGWGLLLSVVPLLSIIPMLFFAASGGDTANALNDPQSSIYLIVMAMNYLNFIFMVVLILFNDYFYMKWCIRKINKLKSDFKGSKEELMQTLNNAGSPSMLNALLLGGGVAVVSYLLTMLITRFI